MQGVSRSPGTNAVGMHGRVAGGYEAPESSSGEGSRRSSSSGGDEERLWLKVQQQQRQEAHSPHRRPA